MAYDLVARLKLVDQMSQPMRRMINSMRGMKKETDAVSRAVSYVNKETKLWRDEQGRLRDGMGRFASESRVASAAFDRIGGSVSNLRGNIGGLHSSLIGLAGAYAAIEGGRKLFDATIGAAAHTEMEQAVIKALFNNTKKADEWFDYVEQRAKDSALFSMDDFLSSSKSYIPMTKDINQLKQLTALTERLAASNKQEGMFGASFSIREAMSGSLESLDERFNLPKQWTKELKGKSGQEFIKTLDSILNRMGFTEKFLGDISDTGLAKYNQLAEKIRLAFKDMGKDGLERAKPILDRLNAILDDKNRMKGVQDFGSDMILKAVEATEKAVVSFDKFMTRISSDEQWKKLSIGDKLVRMTEEGMDAVNKWLDGGGSEKIASMAKPVAETAIGVGAAIGKGLLEGFINYAEKNPLSAAVIGGLAAMKLTGGATLLAAASSGSAIGLTLAAAAGAAITTGLVYAVDKAMEYVEKRSKERYELMNTPLGRAYNRLAETPDDKPAYPSGNMTAYDPSWWERTKSWFENAFSNPFSNYNGIDNVPYDGYKAILHKGERVVPAHENRRGNDAPVVNLNVNSLIVREEADIERIAFALAQQIKGAAVNMG
jgi:hypothetical protein